MAKHEFGIMMDAPQQGTRYDEYEPWKYTCTGLSVSGDTLEDYFLSKIGGSENVKSPKY